MNDREIRKYHMLIEVGNFGTANMTSFRSLPVAVELIETVLSTIKELSTHAAAQESGDSSVRRGATVKAVLREQLREDLQAISRTARAIAIKREGFEDKFRVPREGNDRLLINAARAIASDAVAYVSDFIQFGLPENFLEELNETIELFEKAFTEKMTGKEVRVTATAAIDDSLNRGMEAVRQLDAIVKNRFKDDPAKLAAWVSAKNSGRDPRPKVEDDDTPPTTP
jgi:hypothetical protein